MRAHSPCDTAFHRPFTVVSLLRPQDAENQIQRVGDIRNRSERSHPCPSTASPCVCFTTFPCVLPPPLLVCASLPFRCFYLPFECLETLTALNRLKAGVKGRCVVHSTPTRDTSCCCHPLTVAPCLRFGPRSTKHYKKFRKSTSTMARKNFNNYLSKKGHTGLAPPARLLSCPPSPFGSAYGWRGSVSKMTVSPTGDWVATWCSTTRRRSSRWRRLEPSARLAFC